MRITCLTAPCACAVFALCLAHESTIPHHTLTGYSAGGSVAVLHAVVHSSVVDGLGVIGGSPYGCQILPDSGDTCSGYVSTGEHAQNLTIPWNSTFLPMCDAYLRQREASGDIDPLTNLVGMPVYLYSGIYDTDVYPTTMKAVATQFVNLSAAVRTEFNIASAHAWIVDANSCAEPGKRHPNACCGWKNTSTSCPLPPSAADIPVGGCCGECATGSFDLQNGAWRPPIDGGCSPHSSSATSPNFDLSTEILQWIASNPRGATQPLRPKAPLSSVSASRLQAFNQSSYLPPGVSLKDAQFDDTGFVYVPEACAGPGTGWESRREAAERQRQDSSFCSGNIHVHYHPCGGSWRDVSTSYMLEIALPQFAEANGFVILYPQSAKKGNKVGDGCFDWSGTTGANFDTKSGAQIATVTNMVQWVDQVLQQKPKMPKAIV